VDDSGSDGGNTQGSGTVNVVAAAADEAPQRDPAQAAQGNGPSQDQSQPGLHAFDNGSGAAKEHSQHEALGADLDHGQSQKTLRLSEEGFGTAKGKDVTLGDGLNHGQSQKALHTSDEGSGGAKGNAKHEAPGDDTNHGQAHRGLQAFEEGSTGKPHATPDPGADDLDTGKPRPDLPMASANSVNDAHSALKVRTGATDGASSDDPGKAPVGTALSDSFHFRNGDNNAPSEILDLPLGYGSGKAHGNSEYAAAHKGPVPVQAADAIDRSVQPDPSGHINHYAAHDLIV
jgi:hypothetical protein